MNVDEAIEEAMQFCQQEPNDMLFAEHIAILLAAEVKRLRAEVQRLDMAGTHSCHDDCQRLPCAQRREIERLRAEVEILAVEVTRLQAIEHERIETQTELAAAKAASVLPVGITDLSLCGGGQRIEFYLLGDKSDGAKMLGWLRDRIKERGEG